MTKVKQEKSFTVSWIFIQMQRKLLRFCFICTESAAIAQSICRETLMIIKNAQKMESFSHVAFVVYGMYVS